MYNSNEDMVKSVIHKKKASTAVSVIFGVPLAIVAIWLLFFISSWWAIILGIIAALLALLFLLVYFSEKTILRKFKKYTEYYDRPDVFTSQITSQKSLATSVIESDLGELVRGKYISDYALYKKTGQIIISSSKTEKLADTFDKFIPFYNRGMIKLSEIKPKVFATSYDMIHQELRDLADFGAIERPIFDEENGTIEIITRSPDAPPEEQVKRTVSAEVVALLQEGAAATTELSRLRDSISDVDVKEKIDDIIVITSSIFKKVSEEPERYSQVKRFSTYYLPKTMKLLTTYSDLQHSDVQSDNVDNVLTQIISALDPLTAGLKGIYDSLYDHKVFDIESDIAVLESMLKRDGIL